MFIIEFDWLLSQLILKGRRGQCFGCLGVQLYRIPAQRYNREGDTNRGTV